VTRGFIREAVVAAKAATVREMLEGIRMLPLERLEDFVGDTVRAAAGESFLRRGLEALLDLGRHILAKGFAVPTPEYKQIPHELHKRGVIPSDLTERFLQMAGYRNRMVHFYDEVTPQELYAILTGEVEDVDEVLTALTAWVEEHPERVEASF
jgi:uncharacterized protein YutE (UPF0331/DUF86 family)